MSSNLVVKNKGGTIHETGLVTKYDDGSFAIDGKLYLPEIKCKVLNVIHNIPALFDRNFKRLDFDINKFEIKLTQDDITGVTITVKDSGYGDNSSRYVARQHIAKHEDGHYLKVEINDIVYSIKRVSCKCMSSSTEDGHLPDKVAINTTLDQFFCVGDASTVITKQDIIDAVLLMNRVGYGHGATEGSCWFYDQDYKLVRSFNQKVATVVGTMTPAEAIQIASQLNKRGGWAKVQEFDGSLTAKISQSPKELTDDKKNI